MKTILITLLLLISAAAAFAQEDTSAVLQINPSHQSRVQTNIGITQIHTKAANIRIAWLPLLAPLPYSYPRTTTEVPNALVLTRTEIPQRPHHEVPAARVTLAQR